MTLACAAALLHRCSDESESPATREGTSTSVGASGTDGSLEDQVRRLSDRYESVSLEDGLLTVRVSGPIDEPARLLCEFLLGNPGANEVATVQVLTEDSSGSYVKDRPTQGTCPPAP